MDPTTAFLTKLEAVFDDPNCDPKTQTDRFREVISRRLLNLANIAPTSRLSTALEKLEALINRA